VTENDGTESTEIPETVQGGHLAPGKWNRVVGKAADLLVFIVLAWWDNPVGPLAGLAYLFFADGFTHGRSPGKLLAGLQVIRRRSGKPASFRHSVLRNLPIVFAAILALIPLVGWILFLTLGAGVIAFELYMIFTDEEGARAGDVIADTRVITAGRPVWHKLAKHSAVADGLFRHTTEEPE